MDICLSHSHVLTLYHIPLPGVNTNGAKNVNIDKAASVWLNGVDGSGMPKPNPKPNPNLDPNSNLFIWSSDLNIHLAYGNFYSL